LLATKSPERETRTRAVTAVTAIRRRAELRERARPNVFATTGRVDLFVASTATWLVPEDVRIWQTVLDIAAGLDRQTQFRWRIAGERPSVTPDQFWLVSLKPQFVRSETAFEVPRRNALDKYWPGGILAPSVTAAASLERTLVLSRGPVRSPQRIAQSVVLANGDVSVRGGLEVSVLVCDGDVDIGGPLWRSIVIARGDIKGGDRGGGAIQCALIARGKVTIHARKVAGERLPTAVIENASDDQLGFVKFFELSRVGLEVADADKVVRIKSVADGKTFAAAGARVGDVVEGVNGTKPDSAESLRRMLRDALAVGDATVTVRRGDAVHTLRVVLPES
jgi:hypothetical protein